MPRPSRNVDQLLIESGLTMLPQTGIRGLSIRAVTEHAGVNLGMFHYHFKTKDAFIRTLLEQTYNTMFTSLEMKSKSSASALENLRASVNVLARFGRENRLMMVRMLGDAFAGEEVAIDFLRTNAPRHWAVITSLLQAAQKEGDLKKMPMQQALAFLMGALAAPILAGTAAINGGFASPAVRKQLEQFVFTDAAIAERVDMALAGMAAPKKSGGRK
jgi:AcrR family transcriptional regulator